MKLNNVSRKTVCFGLYIDKTYVPHVFSESPLNTDTRIIRTLWHVPLVSVLTGFHCTCMLLSRPQSVTERPTEIPIAVYCVHQNYVCYKFVNILLNTSLDSGSEINKQGRVTYPVFTSFYFGAEHLEK